MICLGHRIKHLRNKKSIIQSELANEFNSQGCDIATKCAISQYENNKRTPDIKTACNVKVFWRFY